MAALAVCGGNGLSMTKVEGAGLLCRTLAFSGPSLRYQAMPAEACSSSIVRVSPVAAFVRVASIRA